MRSISFLFLVSCTVSGPLVDANQPDVSTGDCNGANCAEICDDGIDNDGDFDVDCDDLECHDSCDWDGDGDGFDSSDSGGGDCDDTNPEINPTAVEVCDGIDNNCTGLIDEADPTIDTSTLLTFYRDADGDGFGVTTQDQKACTVPSGASDVDGDCDDEDAATYPGAIDVPGDCIDQDCDGYTGDQGCEPVYVGEYMVDDGDTWGNNPPVYSCVEACALLFGGVGADYACSTQYAVIDNQANTSTWGVPGCGIVAEDMSVGVTYDCGAVGCSTSAYVTDNCLTTTNYCFQWP